MKLTSILASMAILALTTTSVFATSIPLSCTDGTRNEPVPPTPAVYDIDREAGNPVRYKAGSVQSKCNDGTAPVGWLRAGGFCELSDAGPEGTSHKSTETVVLVSPEIENPDLVIPTATTEYLVITNSPPYVDFTSETVDGSC